MQRAVQRCSSESRYEVNQNVEESSSSSSVCSRIVSSSRAGRPVPGLKMLAEDAAIGLCRASRTASRIKGCDAINLASAANLCCFSSSFCFFSCRACLYDTASWPVGRVGFGADLRSRSKTTTKTRKTKWSTVARAAPTRMAEPRKYQTGYGACQRLPVDSCFLLTSNLARK